MRGSILLFAVLLSTVAMAEGNKTCYDEWQRYSSQKGYKVPKLENEECMKAMNLHTPTNTASLGEINACLKSCGNKELIEEMKKGK